MIICIDRWLAHEQVEFNKSCNLIGSRRGVVVLHLTFRNPPYLAIFLNELAVIECFKL